MYIQNSNGDKDCFTTSTTLPDGSKHDMDALKIISKDGKMDDLLGVFHATRKGQNNHYSASYLAENKSGDLCKGWTVKNTMTTNGSMGYLFPYHNGYLFAYELESDSGNTIAFRYYKSYAELISNRTIPNQAYVYEYQLDRNVYLPGNNYASPVKNIGTPSIESVSSGNNQINFKLHYFPKGEDMDIPAYGTVNINPKVYSPDKKGIITNYGNSAQKFDTEANNAIRIAGGSGKIGQRDWFTYKNHRYYIYEAQTCKSNYKSDKCWASWRLFLYSEDENRAEQVTFNNCGSDSAFANPHTQVIQGNLIISAFIPSQTNSKHCDYPGEFIRSIKL